MFAFQQQKINVLIEVLKSKGILEGDDLRAFEFATHADVPANAALALEVSTFWANLCQKAGVDLPLLPQNPLPEA